MSRVMKISTILLSSVLLLATMGVAAPTASSAASPAPSVVPALASWTPADGSLTLGPDTRIVVDGGDQASLSTAQTFRTDLRAARPWDAPVVRSLTAAHPGDIVLRHDPSRSDLGAEGYSLKIGQQVEVTGATAAGIFYGTRTILQLLASGDQLPAGSSVDVPSYRERGVAVCACYTYYSQAWMDRLIKDMAYLKLNYLHLEIKVSSTQFPNINFFSYYTPAEIQHIVDLAGKYHITVVPEINSPGHIDPYIQNYPDLQLVDKNGVADATRLDVTKPEAFSFYTGLIDEYFKLFPGPYFHMGADEYMLGSAYANYPQLLAYAQAKYGPNAVAQDAYIDFINRVDAYVQSKGRTLRIWNDGLTGVNTVPLNKDVIVEHWLGEPVTPQNLLDEGHTVMNASAAFYYIRGGSRPNSQNLYQTDWSPADFVDGPVAGGQPGLSGAEMAIWPDNYGAETENTTQANVFMPLRVLAQATWGSPHPTTDYASFQTMAQAIGHAPGWGPAFVQPVAQGSYVVQSPRGVLTSPTTATSQLTVSRTSSTWTLTPTADGYYRLVSDATGLCADMRRGTPNRLGVVEQEGAPVTAETCSTRRTQEWQLEPVPGGYRIVDAITQEAAVVDNGNVEQQPRVVATNDVWRLTGS
jgi:hexosaminidase